MTPSFPDPGAPRTSFLSLLGLIGLAFALPHQASAQVSPRGSESQEEAACDVPSHGGLVITTLANEDRMLAFQRPTIRCPGGIRIRADSARVFESTNYNQLWGNVVFWDAESRLSADQAQYFSDQRRLVARGNAVLRDLAEGSVIEGENVTLIRAGPRRQEDFLTVSGGSPHATLYPTRQPVPEPEPAPTDTAAISTDTAAAPPDTAAISTDTAAAPPDTAAAPADTAAAPADTALAVSDTIFTPTDTVTAPGDTTRIVPDSVAPALPDSVAGRQDSTVVPARPDSVAATPPDTTAAAVPPDTTVAPLDTASTLLDPEPRRPPPEGEPLRPPAEPEAEEEERVPYEIDAQRFVLEGDRYFRAAGSVVVTRDSLTAVADSLEYDQDQGALFLSEEARVTTAETDLAAETIRLDIPRDEIRRATATGEAALKSEDLQLLAPIVDLFFTQGQMERLVAQRDAAADSLAGEEMAEGDPEPVRRRPLREAAVELGFQSFPPRPYAVAREFILEGDSVEVLTPDEVLREVWAIGNARGESAGRDSLNTSNTPTLISRDWLQGDTIVAFFGEATDSTSSPAESRPLRDPEPQDAEAAQAEYRLERLLARGSARSMYRMAASDSTVAAEGDQFAVHYVVGDEITILLNEEGEAERMDVKGQTQGIHLEPVAEGARRDTAAAPDTAAVPDTVEVPDTAAVSDTATIRDPVTPAMTSASDSPRVGERRENPAPGIGDLYASRAFSRFRRRRGGWER